MERFKHCKNEENKERNEWIIWRVFHIKCVFWTWLEGRIEIWYGAPVFEIPKCIGWLYANTEPQRNWIRFDKALCRTGDFFPIFGRYISSYFPTTPTELKRQVQLCTANVANTRRRKTHEKQKMNTHKKCTKRKKKYIFANVLQCDMNI